MGGAWLACLALLVALATIMSCAQPIPPGGGPLDEQPPWLVAARPESAATGLGPVRELSFEFSEKMERTDAFRWLRLYPRQTIRQTRWQAARVAVVTLEEALPADTVVVVEIVPGMKDSHNVPQMRGRMWAFATGDSLADGEVVGTLVLEGKPVIGGVAELLPAGPDSVRLAQRPVLRRALTDSLGAFRLRWLPASGDRWLLRTFEDRNNDGRPGDNEAQRLWPDTLVLAPPLPRIDTGVRVLYPPTAPGSLAGRLEGRPAQAGRVVAFVAGIADGDTGYVPRPQTAAMATLNQAVPDTGRFVLTGAGPGLVRAVFFVDADGDSLFSAVGAPADSVWWLEPWAMVDSLRVEPGLAAPLPAPVWPDTLTPWARPVAPDTLAVSPADTVQTDPEEGD